LASTQHDAFSLNLVQSLHNHAICLSRAGDVPSAIEAVTEATRVGSAVGEQSPEVRSLLHRLGELEMALVMQEGISRDLGTTEDVYTPIDIYDSGVPDADLPGTDLLESGRAMAPPDSKRPGTALGGPPTWMRQPPSRPEREIGRDTNLREPPDSDLPGAHFDESQA